MSDRELAQLINSRFDALEARISALEGGTREQSGHAAQDRLDDAKEDAAMKAKFEHLTDAYTAFRNALYGLAVSLLGAAVLLVVHGVKL